MSIFHIPLVQVTGEHIRELWFNEVRESATCDFKLRIPSFEANPPELPREAQDKNKIALLSDIAAFANADGGDLLVGVDEEPGEGFAREPREESFRGFLPSDKIEGKLRDLCRTHLEPAFLIPIHARRISVASTGGKTFEVMVIRIPAGTTTPHAVCKDDSLIFKRRVLRHNQPMDMHSVREEVLASDGQTDRLRQFREDRLAAVHGQAQNKVFMLHIQPLSAMRRRVNLGVTLLAPEFQSENAFKSALIRFGKEDGPIYSRLNASGFGFEIRSRPHPTSSRSMSEFRRWFRSGVFEWYFQGSLEQPGRADMAEPLVPWADIETHFIEEMSKLPAALNRLGLAGPVCFTISGAGLVGINAGPVHKTPDEDSRPPIKFMDSKFSTAETVVSDPASVSDWGAALAALTEQVWNSTGNLGRPQFLSR